MKAYPSPDRPFALPPSGPLPTVAVIVIGNGDPFALSGTLASIDQQIVRPVETVVFGDPSTGAPLPPGARAATPGSLQAVIADLDVDLALLLEAGEALLPHGVETLRGVWTGSVALVLPQEEIDAFGRTCGPSSPRIDVDVDLAALAASTPGWEATIRHSTFAVSPKALGGGAAAETAEDLLLVAAQRGPVRWLDAVLIQRRQTDSEVDARPEPSATDRTLPLRWPLAIAVRQVPERAERFALTAAIGAGWLLEAASGTFRTGAASADLHLRIVEQDGPIAIALHMRLPDGDASSDTRVTMRCNGAPSVSACVPEDGAILEMVVDRPDQDGRLRIELTTDPGDATVLLSAIRWRAVAEQPPAVRLEPNARLAAADLAPLADERWRTDASTAAVVDGEAELRLVIPAGGPYDLVLDPARAAHGLLTLRADPGGVLYQGPLLGSSIVLPFPERPEPTSLFLAVRFEPHSAFPDDKAVFASGELVHRRVLQPFQLTDAALPPVLNADNLVTLEETPDLFALYVGPSSASGTTIQFRTTSDRRNLRLTLQFSGDGTTDVLQVVSAGRCLAELRVEGSGTACVALPDGIRDPDGSVRIAIRTIGEEPVAGGRGGRLTGLLLEGDSVWIRNAARRPPQPRPRPRLLRLLERVPAEDLPRHPGAQAQETIGTFDPHTLRADVLDELSDLPDAVLETTIQFPDVLARIDRLGAEGWLTASDHRSELADPTEDFSLRAALVDMLTRPAYRSPRFRTLKLHPALLRHPGIVARYMTREPIGIIPIEETTAIVQHAETVFSEAAALIADQPENSRLFHLAVQWTLRWQSKRAVFGASDLLPLMNAKARAIERRLDRLGACRFVPLSSRPGVRRLRIGVLLRHTRPGPEAWAAAGMYAGLPKPHYETVLLTLSDDRPDAAITRHFDMVMTFAGSDFGEVVRGIRSLSLDCLILGAYAPTYDELSDLIAHRLAPLQILPTVMSPTTLGFGTFDVALLTGATETTQTSGRHYAEPTATLNGPIQGCYLGARFQARTVDRRPEAREVLGLESDAVVFAAGAVSNKIHRETLDAWIRILAEAPDAVLLLYPFAENWWIRHDEARIRADIAEAAARGGVDTTRIRVYDECDEAAVLTILAAADLFLDSFPYSGAVTVCEAAASGVPCIALEGRDHRHRTGAAWIRAFGFPELVAADVAGYIGIAVDLARDRTRLETARKRLRAWLETSPPHLDTASYGKGLAKAIADLAAASGHFPDLFPQPPPSPLMELPMPLSEAAPQTGSPPEPVHRGSLGTAPERERRAKRLVVLSAERSGSTLLCNIISAAPGAVCHHELFHPTQIQFRGNTRHDPASIRRRDMDPVGFLEDVLSEADADDLGLFGFKLFAGHGDQILDHVVADPETRLILLVRTNILAQYASSVIARQTGIWAAPRASESSRHVKIDFDPEEFARFLERMQAEQLSMLARLASAGRQALLLDYASVASGRSIPALENHLGLSLSTTAAEPLLRQNNPDILARFQNPGDVVAALASIRRLDWLSEEI